MRYAVFFVLGQLLEIRIFNAFIPVAIAVLLSYTAKIMKPESGQSLVDRCIERTIYLDRYVPQSVF